MANVCSTSRIFGMRFKRAASVETSSTKNSKCISYSLQSTAQRLGLYFFTSEIDKRVTDFKVLFHPKMPKLCAMGNEIRYPSHVTGAACLCISFVIPVEHP